MPAALATLIVTSSPGAEDWPQWRGPLLNGVSPESGLPLAWSEETLAWSVALVGHGVSSPVVAGDRVFVTSQRGRDSRRPGTHPKLARNDPAVAASERAMPVTEAETDGATVFVVQSFARLDGRELWRYELEAEGELPRVHEKHNLASPSPVTDGELVYAWFGNGQLVALSLSGDEVWRRHLGREHGDFEIDWGHGSSPAVHGELLYLLCFHEPRSYLLAVDKRTGATRFRIDRGQQVRSYSTPILIPADRGHELVINSTEGLHAYDPETGALLWRAGGEHRFGIPVPSFHDGVLYASRGYRSGPYLAMRPGGRGDVNDSHVLWQVPTGAPYVSSLLHYEGLVYMASDSGIVTCVDAATGEKVWQQRTGEIFAASPVAGDGKIYLMSETGTTIVYRAGREPEEIARNRIEGRVTASPAISGGRLFVRTDDRLVAIGG